MGRGKEGLLTFWEGVTIVALLAHPATDDPAELAGYRGTSLIRNSTPLGPYSRPMPRVLGGSAGG